MKITQETFINTVKNNIKLGSLVLDLGAGSGEITLPLYDAGYHVHYLDIAQEMINIFFTRKAERNIPVYLNNIMNFVPNNILYDAIVSRFAFCHYPNISPLFDKCLLILKPGGMLFPIQLLVMI